MTGRRHVTLIGGPLDGMEFLAYPDDDTPGAFMVVPGAAWRAVYEPDPGGDPDRWHYQGPIG